MSFDLPASVEREVQRYAETEHISPAEAVVRLIQDALKAKHKGTDESLVLDEQIRQLKALAPGTFGLLEDVPDEQIDHMATTIRRMKREGFSPRA